MRSFLYTICFIFLVGCSGITENENCKYLLDINFNIPVNLSLPQYSQLQFAGNSVYIANYGNGGIIIASTGADFLAWDARDPNRSQTSCSILVNSGLEATSGCDDENTYSLVTGQGLGSGELPCSLKNYRVQKNGNILTIYN